MRQILDESIENAAKTAKRRKHISAAISIAAAVIGIISGWWANYTFIWPGNWFPRFSYPASNPTESFLSSFSTPLAFITGAVLVAGTIGIPIAIGTAVYKACRKLFHIQEYENTNQVAQKIKQRGESITQLFLRAKELNCVWPFIDEDGFKKIAISLSGKSDYENVYEPSGKADESSNRLWEQLRRDLSTQENILFTKSGALINIDNINSIKLPLDHNHYSISFKSGPGILTALLPEEIALIKSHLFPPSPKRLAKITFDYQVSFASPEISEYVILHSRQQTL